ncbi:MAG: TIGR03435 family protein [Terriglobia bacterium]
MIPNYLHPLWPAIGSALADHLWQSTLFAVVACLLTLALRKNHARARYWIWLAASLKFLVPFSLLIGLGSYLATSTVPADTQPALYSAVEEVSQPFTQVATPAISQSAVSHAAPGVAGLLPLLLAALWLAGFLTVLCRWFVRWRRTSQSLQEAVPLQAGRELESLRRLERVAGIRKPIEMLLSRQSLEPGIFGLVRPVLVWPAGISEHLENAHMESILAHELCHVRRRDNLAMALHMLVEAIFWFHPLVWWFGVQLLEERERACDEAVLQLGNEPHVYAESILKTCEFCVSSPLACVSGVTGSDLKKRIFRIVASRAGVKLDLQKKLLLVVAALLAIVVPIGLGLANGKPGQANPPQATASPQTAGATPKFEVASIKPDKSSGPKMMFRITNPPKDGRFYSTGPTLRMLIRMAYDIQDSQIEGGPSWINSERFDIQAEANSAVNAELSKLPVPQALALKRRMIQSLLADRFNLKVHHETKELPMYALVVAKHGPKIKAAQAADSAPIVQAADSGPTGPGGHVAGRRGIMFRAGPGGASAMSFQEASLSDLAQVLSQQLGRTVVDETGLKGLYSFTLKFTGEGGPRGAMKFGPEGGGGQVAVGPVPGGGEGPGKPVVASPDSSAPSLFTALQQTLGLKLKSEKGPVDVLVIDQVEQPSAN